MAAVCFACVISASTLSAYSKPFQVLVSRKQGARQSCAQFSSIKSAYKRSALFSGLCAFLFFTHTVALQLVGLLTITRPARSRKTGAARIKPISLRALNHPKLLLPARFSSIVSGGIRQLILFGVLL
jgi:hypothetical protein